MVRFFLLEEYSGSVGGGGMGGGGRNNGLGAVNGNNNSSSTGSSPRTQGYASNTSTPYNSNGNYSTMSPPHQLTPSSAAIFNAATSSRKKIIYNKYVLIYVVHMKMLSSFYTIYSSSKLSLV